MSAATTTTREQRRRERAERRAATQHVWQAPMRQQSTCWCQPFVSTEHGAIVDAEGLVGIAYHRPDRGHLFREYGEQGPFTALQARMEEA